MLVSLLSWIYIGAFCLSAGVAVRGILGHFFAMEKRPEHMSAAGTMVYGIIAVTVYAEWFSIAAGVGALCHILLLALTAVCIIRSDWARTVLRAFLRRVLALRFTAAGWFLLVFVLVVAFFTSRGTFHTDTGIYQAQAIRILEEYGVIKGLANLQLHFGYNSAYLVFCAFFSMRWLTGTALHTTTGFLMALLGAFAFHGLKDLARHAHHGADAMRIALLIYILTNLTGAMSPATDYGTILLILYLFCAFLETAQRDDAADDAQRTVSFGMIAMGGLFVVSMKLSAAAVFLLVLYPVSRCVRQGQWRVILRFAALGVVIFLPYLIRNVILSGWLFYPFEAIDLFNVEWKVPVEYSLVDSRQIKVWGRCLYDIALIDMPLSGWLPVWWEAQQHYTQLLIYADLLSLPLLLCDAVLARRRGRRVSWEIVNFVLMLCAGMALWLFTAPFVRYGLAYILALPLLALGLFAEEQRGNRFLPAGRPRPGTAVWKAAGAWLGLLMIMSFGAWIDRYAMDDLVFIKHNAAEPYYIAQKPYDQPEMGSEQLGEVTVYYAVEGELNSYYVTPSTCYRFMLERSELIGDTIREGFRAKETDVQ